MQGLIHRSEHRVVDLLLVAKPQFHLGRMDIYIHRRAVDGDVEHYKGILVLHGEILVSVLNGLVDHLVFDVSSVDKIGLKVPVPSGDQRRSQISGDVDPLFLMVYLQKVGRDLPPVDMVDHILQVSVAGGVEPGLAVIDKLERDLRVGQSQPGHKVADMACLCHWRLQEFTPGRGVVEKLAHQEGGAVSGPGILHALFLSSRDPVDSAECLRLCLGDQFHLGHCRNAGKSFSPEPQGSDVGKVLRCTDLAGGMAQKSRRHLGFLNSATVVGNTDVRDPAFFDLCRHRRGACVDGILHQFLHNGGRALDHLAGGDLVYGYLIQYLNLVHMLPPVFQFVLKLIQCI